MEFCDYFKKEAIKWAWEFLINICNLDSNRMYVTYFEGSSNDGTEKDIESYDIWKELLPEDRIIAGNKKDNFWEMGDVGPLVLVQKSILIIDLKKNRL